MSKINFPKKQEQRLIPKYLLEYSEELVKNHPDPSESWGGSGSTYTAGEGIVIENNEISVDAEDVALVKNLATVAFSGSYSDLSNKPDLSVYELKEDAFSGDYNDLTNKPTLFSGNYNDLTNKPDLSVYELKSEAFSGNYNDLINKPTIPTDTSDLTNGAGYITGIDSADVITALGYTPGTSNFSGNYNDLTNKPTIPPTVSGTNDGTNWTTITIGNTTKNIPTGGSNYTAGTGIDITNDVISVDNTVAMKTDIPADVTNITISGALGTLSASELTLVTTTPEKAAFINGTNYLVYCATGQVNVRYGMTYQGNSTISICTLLINKTNGVWTYTVTTNNIFSGDYDDLTNKPDLSIYAQSADLAQVAITGSYNDLSNTPTIPTKTSDLTNDSGFITGVTWNDVTGKPTFATVATSGSYDDLSNKPTIPVVPTNVSAFTNDAGYITNTVNNLTNYTLSSNLATIATSGSYADLTNKPDITNVFSAKYISLDSYTGNKLNLNTDATYTTGSIMLTQVAYDSTTQKYYGYTTISYRPYISKSWSAGYQLFSFNTTYWHPQISNTIPGVISVNATSGSMSSVNFGISSAGTVTIETARSATTGINVNFVTTIPVVFDTDLRTW